MRLKGSSVITPNRSSWYDNALGAVDREDAKKVMLDALKKGDDVPSAVPPHDAAATPISYRVGAQLPDNFPSSLVLRGEAMAITFCYSPLQQSSAYKAAVAVVEEVLHLPRPKVFAAVGKNVEIGLEEKGSRFKDSAAQSAAGKKGGAKARAKGHLESWAKRDPVARAAALTRVRRFFRTDFFGSLTRLAQAGNNTNAKTRLKNANKLVEGSRQVRHPFRFLPLHRAVLTPLVLQRITFNGTLDIKYPLIQLSFPRFEGTPCSYTLRKPQDLLKAESDFPFNEDDRKACCQARTAYDAKQGKKEKGTKARVRTELFRGELDAWVTLVPKFESDSEKPWDDSAFKIIIKVDCWRTFVVDGREGENGEGNCDELTDGDNTKMRQAGKITMRILMAQLVNMEVEVEAEEDEDEDDSDDESSEEE